MGGTVTTLVALVHELEPYDSSFVHLCELSLEQVSAAIERMSVLDAEGIATLPGVQPKRAGVILAGAVVIRELMRAGGYKTLTVSENSYSPAWPPPSTRPSTAQPHHRLDPQPQRPLTIPS